MATFIEIKTAGGPTSLNVDAIWGYSPADPRPEDGVKRCYIQHNGHMHLAIGFDAEMLATILRRGGHTVINMRP